MKVVPILLGLALVDPFFAMPAGAVSEGAPALFQPLLITSARAAALGGVTAVIEESGISGWRNPGFLAFDRKIRATATRTQLVPDLADDIRLRSVLVSARLEPAPVTVAAGYAKLDFGESFVIDDQGNETASFSSYDETGNVSVAVELWRTIGVGVTLEHVYSKLADPIPELNILDGDADALAVSFGAGARRRFELALGESDASTLVITPLAGASFLHLGGELAYNDEDQAEGLPRQLHLGAGLRIAHEPRRTTRFFDAARLSRVFVAGYIERMTEHVAEQDVIESPSPFGNDDDEERIMHYGYEIGLCGIASIRFGRVDDPEGDITDDTNGWGVGVEDVLPFDVRLDYASFPQATGLDRVKRWDVMISFDPAFLEH